MTEIAHTCAHAVATEGGLARIDIVDLNRGLRSGLHSRDGDYVRPLELAAARPHQDLLTRGEAVRRA